MAAVKKASGQAANMGVVVGMWVAIGCRANDTGSLEREMTNNCMRDEGLGPPKGLISLGQTPNCYQ